MSELRSAVGSARRTASTITARVVEVVTTLLLVGGLVGWSLFWTNLVQLHYAAGDVASAVVTTALFIVPALALAAWRVVATLGVDVPTPQIDANPISG
jgi:hypothetical protein